MDDIQNSTEERRRFSDAWLIEISAMRNEMTAQRAQITVLEKIAEQQNSMMLEHDKILVRGNGVPSLQESVRVLTKLITDFIVTHEAGKKERQDENKKLKWFVIAALIAQAVELAFKYVIK